METKITSSLSDLFTRRHEAIYRAAPYQKKKQKKTLAIEPNPITGAIKQQTKDVSEKSIPTFNTPKICLTG